MLLAGTELATAVPDVPDVPEITDELLLTGAVLEALCPGDAVGDAEELLAEEDVLAEDDAEFGAAVVLGLAFGPLLVQLPWVSELVVALAAEAAAEAEVVAAALPLALALALLLGVPPGLAGALLLLAAGLAGELDVAGVGVTDADADAEVLAELAELAAVEGEGDAEDCGHDEIGVGAVRCFAAVVRAAATPPPPLPSACPPPPAAAAPGAELADGWLLSTPETDEATAWRSGGTEASTTPTTNTAQATAIAGLSIAIRQSRGRCWPRPPPADPPACRAYQRRTVSARKPELAGTGEPACLLA